MPQGDDDEAVPISAFVTHTSTGTMVAWHGRAQVLDIWSKAVMLLVQHTSLFALEMTDTGARTRIKIIRRQE